MHKRVCSNSLSFGSLNGEEETAALKEKKRKLKISNEKNNNQGERKISNSSNNSKHDRFRHTQNV